METFIELAKRLLEKSKRIKEGYASEQDLLSDNTNVSKRVHKGITVNTQSLVQMNIQ